jgi:hypothetical protein
MFLNDLVKPIDNVSERFRNLLQLIFYNMQLLPGQDRDCEMPDCVIGATYSFHVTYYSRLDDTNLSSKAALIVSSQNSDYPCRGPKDNNGCGTL